MGTRKSGSKIMEKRMEIQSISESNDSETYPRNESSATDCLRRPDGIKTFRCNLCGGSGILGDKTKNENGYYNYMPAECHKCNGSGIVDWVANLCYENK
jgi:DnaJ-class molecular chaperone